MKRIVSVDSGKYATKAAMKEKNGATRQIKFRTKMDRTQEDTTSVADSFVVEFDGKKYLIGNEAETTDFDRSKAKEIHRLCTYLAIARLVENNEEVYLVVGCPLEIYYNVEERKAYEQYIKGTGNISITINGKQKNFRIMAVNALAESSGIIYKNGAKFRDDVVGIIDIGGLNVNGCVYEKMVPRKPTLFTSNLGANVYRNELRQRLNSTFKDANLQEYLMDKVIRDGYIKQYKEESAKVIQEFRQEYFERVMKDCKKKDWDLNNMDIIFIGGGSAMISNEIKAAGYALGANENQLDKENVLGFLAVGVVAYEK